MLPSNGRPWTAEEDSLLIQAISIHGENDKWQTIAQSIPGRTNKACRKRWLHSLSPSVKKTPWTAEEDQKLLTLYAIHSTKWSIIARHIHGRTDDACSKRYREALDPSLRKDEWTADEDARLLDAYARIGGKWGQIGQELKRSGLGCRNRWRMIERKRAAALRKEANTDSSNVDPSGQGNNVDDWSDLSIYNDPSFWSMDVGYTDPTPANTHTFSSTAIPQDHTTVTSGVTVTPQQFLVPHTTSLNSTMLYASQSALPQFGPLPQPMLEWAASGNTYEEDESRYPSSNVRTMEPAGAQDPVDAAFDSPHTIDNPLEPAPGPSRHSSYPTTRDPSRSPSSGPSFMTVDSPSTLSQPLASTGLSSGSAITTGAECPVVQQVDSQCSSTTTLSTNSKSPYYRPPCRNRPRATTNTKSSASEGATPRLSATLPASNDPTILPYACGHLTCWPPSAQSGIACYSTSQELSDHYKAEHEGALIQEDSKPFRCGLDGCTKGWKSINGLQYHLQVSKAHFRTAIATNRRQQNNNNSSPVALNSTMNDAPAMDADPPPHKKARKKHPCPHPDCSNEYKQLSGLRYHLSHGHSSELPAQLEIVPPTLARKVAEQAAVASSGT